MARSFCKPCVCVFSFLGIVVFLQLFSPHSSQLNQETKEQRSAKFASLSDPNLLSNTSSYAHARHSTNVSELINSLPASQPANVNGTYRGKWTKVQEGNLLYKLRLLTKDQGWVFYSIRKIESNSPNTSVVDVEGDIILRQNQLIADSDVKMSLTGIYVPVTGQLSAVLNTNTPINGNLTDNDIKTQNEDYQKTLRYAAAVVSTTSHFRVIHPDADNVLRQLDLAKECQLRLDVRVQPYSNVTANDGNNATNSDSDKSSYQDTGLIFGPSDDNGIFMEGKLYSPNCGLELNINGTTYDLPRYYSKVLRYTSMVSAVSLIQMILLPRQMGSTGTPAGLASVSMLCMGQQALIDAYLCLVHFTAGILIEQLFNAFSVAALCEFVIFAIFELRYLLMIWKARRGSAADSWQLRNELSMLYARFYGALLGGVVLSYALKSYQHWMLMGLYSFWIPQIVYSAYNDTRQPLQPTYVVGMTLTRLVLPMYVYACPYGISQAANLGLTFPLVLMSYCFIQAGLLLLQWKYGPRCFIPKRFLPPKYDYYRQFKPQNIDEGNSNREMDEEMGYGSVECVICFNPVPLNSRSQRMVTPCNHVFHPACLQQWMNVKLECPTCRHQLPPL
eukprot:TRINITY_DN849_c0_g1_i1.p1 TRINITY_DN849_c0_g1~~TRINITY_DN849_c0_g1_i1.p1  ORF type:complete len:617 (-),score=27.18 TRINITY_DN849_c0_g1_i1:841-2691(-)